MAANQLAYVVIIVLNNRFDAGPQIYTTAFTVFQLPHAIFAVSIFTALLPSMSERWSSGHPEGVRALVSRGLRDTAVVTIPAAVGLLVMAEPITRLLFEHGEAVARDSVAIARTLQGFAAGLLFFSTFQLLTRTFYAMQDTRTPALVNVVTGVVNVAAALDVRRPARSRPPWDGVRARHLLRRRSERAPRWCSGAASGRSTGDASRARRPRHPSPRQRPRSRRSRVVGAWDVPGGSSMLAARRAGRRRRRGWGAGVPDLGTYPASRRGR